MDYIIWVGRSCSVNVTYPTLQAEPFSVPPLLSEWVREVPLLGEWPADFGSKLYVQHGSTDSTTTARNIMLNASVP